MIPPKANVSFREMLTGDQFYYGAEVVTSRNWVAAESSDRVVSMANDLLADPRIGWISITDNPGGGPMLPPDWLAGRVAEQRKQVVIHLTCKDMNRNALEGAAWRYASEGFGNILALTGDYPAAGYGGAAQPVFDLDSLGLIALMRAMNDGLKIEGRGGKPMELEPTDFFLGCAASPFKRLERELIPQYFKLLRKIAAGARWVIPQLGYDMRKFHEIKLLLESRGLDIPVIGNVYLLTKGVARLFNSGKLAGCVCSDELWEKAQKYAAGEDKGRKFFRELAAKQLAVFKGLGFAAGYLGGISKPETFGSIIEMADSFGDNDWRAFLKEIRYSLPDEFFLFEHDPETGMSSPTQINPEFKESLKKPKKGKHVTLGYRFSRMVHWLAFSRDRRMWGFMRRLYGWLDKKPEGTLSKMAHGVEHGSKAVYFGCQDCGDCMLPDCSYMCPMRGCSKQSRNGPCGGSADGVCELDDKECFWARVYDRLKYYGEQGQMLQSPVVYYDRTKEGTSAWSNTYLDRDHAAPDAPNVYPITMPDGEEYWG